MRIILYIAISSDGFIADKNGGVAWLDEYNNEEIAREIDEQGCGFKDFYNSIDALIIGNTTYKQMLTFGPWTFTDKKNYIFSSFDTPKEDAEYIEFVNTDIPTFMKKISSKSFKRVWLVGGAMLAESFYNLGLIDEYIITVIPKKLGEGIPLLPAIVQAEGLTLVDTKKFNSGIEQRHYVRMITMNFGDVLIKKSGIGQFDDGLGVFANRDYKKGEIVIKWNLKILSSQEYEKLPEYEKANFCHNRNGIIYYYPDPERHVNRSKNPNVFSDIENEANIALRDINTGEELSISDTTKEDF